MNNKIQMIFQSIKGNFDFVHKKEKCRTLLELIGDDSMNLDINFFPSDKKGVCHSDAIFVSLIKSPIHVSLENDQLVPLDKIMPILFKQTLIECLNINKNVYLLTDNIETKEFLKWGKHFKLMEELEINIEIYYIGGSTLKKINDLVL